MPNRNDVLKIDPLTSLIEGLLTTIMTGFETEGAIPNGTYVRKIHSESKHRSQDGDIGKVIGSVAAKKFNDSESLNEIKLATGQEVKIVYVVEWNKNVEHPNLIADFRLELAPDYDPYEF